MTSVADTRLLITLKFPPTEETAQRTKKLVTQEIRRTLLIPSIVIAEYIKIAGGKLGFDAALTHINEIEDRGAIIVELDRKTAVEAGKVLLKNQGMPMADALIAATSLTHKAEHILTDDSHFQEMGFKIKWL